MSRLLVFILLAVALAAGLTYAGQHWNLGPVVITREGEQKIILRLDKALRTTSPGLDWKVPFLDATQSYSSQWLHEDTDELRVDTRDGEQLTIDSYVIWRIAEPVEFFVAFKGKTREASERIDRIVHDRVREVIGRHTLVEVLKDRREGIAQEITGRCREDLMNGGVEVSDVRINRTDLPAGTEGSVFARMRTERERLAMKSRAEGDEQARGIRAEADREAQVIVANARRDAEIARGMGDAQAARIYADAYETEAEFYAFTRTLEAYRRTIDGNTTLIVSPGSEFFKYLDANGK